MYSITVFFYQGCFKLEGYSIATLDLVVEVLLIGRLVNLLLQYQVFYLLPGEINYSSSISSVVHHQ